MRKGANPQKMKAHVMTGFTHQVIIPVYIPYHNNYFKDSLKVLKICIESLIKTTHNNTFITIANNGSDNVVAAYLNQLLEEGNIHEVVHTINVGKINALIKGLKGHLFDLITVADSDVLFLNNWQEETIKIFNAFPKAGVVGVVPQYKLHAALSFNLLFDKFWSNKLKFRSIINRDAIKHFYNSINWEAFEDQQLEKHLTLKNSDGTEAVVGSAHFIATYNSDALNHMPAKTCKVKMHEVEREYFDEPVLKVDGWRLTTVNNYAYHMGNAYEPWMTETLNQLITENDSKDLTFKKSNLNGTGLSYYVKNVLFRKLMSNRYVLRRFLLAKGLSKKSIQEYISEGKVI